MVKTRLLCIIIIIRHLSFLPLAAPTASTTTDTGDDICPSPTTVTVTTSLQPSSSSTVPCPSPATEIQGVHVANHFCVLPRQLSRQYSGALILYCSIIIIGSSFSKTAMHANLQ